MLPTPGFHHLHLNSVDPDAAIDFYTRQFPSTKKGSWGGIAALESPNDVLVLFSSDTWPSVGNTLGLTREQIAEAKGSGVEPTRKGGFAYMSGGPEDALFEIAGDYPAKRFNHVHMWHEQPFCALLWYKKHLN